MTFRYEKVSEVRIKRGIIAIKKEGGYVTGDDGGGSFGVSGVTGNYSYYAGTLIITILDKPWLASWGIIEDKLNQFFN